MEGDTGSSNTASNKHFVWTPDKDALLVESLMELQGDQEFMQNSNLKSGAFKKIERKLEQKAPGCGIKASPHIQSRMKTLKVSWQTVYDMIHGPNASGFGWDNDRKCVYADDAVWDEYVKSIKKAAAWRHKPFPHFKALTEFWAKDRATGQGAEDGHDMVEETEAYRPDMPAGIEETTQDEPGVNDDLCFSEASVEQGPEASSSLKRRKRGRVEAEDFAEMFKDFGRVMQQSMNEVTAQICSSINRTSSHSETIVAALSNVRGLTPIEKVNAHAKLASSDMLWKLFTDEPDENKAEFIRQLLMN